LLAPGATRSVGPATVHARSKAIRGGPVSSAIGTGSCTRRRFGVGRQDPGLHLPADHQRTRLTHALEVVQIANAIARACRLNVALTEAIALGHDCAHGPGGHASEEALSPFLPEGFDHAVGARMSPRRRSTCVRDLGRDPEPFLVAAVARTPEGRSSRSPTGSPTAPMTSRTLSTLRS